VTQYDVSVVIPCYNMADTIGHAVASAANQRNIQVEVIVVDDGSTDGSALAALKPAYGNVSVLSLPQNYGASAALNAGAQVVSGRYIYAFGADDWLEPDILQHAVHLLDAYDDVGFVYGSVQYHGDRTDIYTPPQEYRAEDFYTSYCAISGYVWRTRCWREGVRWRDGINDWDHVLQLIERGWQGAVIPQVMFNYYLKQTGYLWGLKQRKDEVLAEFKSRWPLVTATDF